jgi:hypothetical protein
MVPAGFVRNCTFELLEHVFAYLGIPISLRHAGQGVSAVGGQWSYVCIAVALLALST